MRVKYNMVTDEQRRQTKNLVYAIYGSGSNSFARKDNVSENEGFIRMLDELKSTTFLGIKYGVPTLLWEKTKTPARAAV